MNLEIFTLALDAMPQLSWHLPVFNRLNCPWLWTIIHGAAMNGGSTKWCARQQPRLSRDGTGDYLKSISYHPRVRIIEKEEWESKDAMCNAAVNQIREPCILHQIDSDEVWSAEQLEKIYRLMVTMPKYNMMQYYCRFFIGQNIVTTGVDSYGNNPGEWNRTWHYKPGMVWKSHEPPILFGCEIPFITRDESRAHGLVFDHYSYVFENQVAFKGQFYKYPNILSFWRRLQQNKQFPVKRLKSYLPWVDERASADTLFKT